MTITDLPQWERVTLDALKAEFESGDRFFSQSLFGGEALARIVGCSSMEELTPATWFQALHLMLVNGLISFRTDIEPAGYMVN